jgi:hypothetical protein
MVQFLQVVPDLGVCLTSNAAIAEINTGVGVARGVHPKSAIAEISTRGTPHNHLTANHATTTGSRGAGLLDARLHPLIPFHANKQRAQKLALDLIP